jgi:hypothetical protein
MDRQALIAVRGPLSVLFWSYYLHYSIIMRIILAIILIISKIQTAFRVSIHCRNPPPWFPSPEAAQKQQIIVLRLLEQKQQIILNRPRVSSPVPWMGWLPLPPAVLVFKQTIAHGLTKLSAQSINLLGDGVKLVLPHVIRKTKIDTNLNSQNNQHNMHNYHNTYMHNNYHNTHNQHNTNKNKQSP